MYLNYIHTNIVMYTITTTVHKCATQTQLQTTASIVHILVYGIQIKECKIY